MSGDDDAPRVRRATIGPDDRLAWVAIWFTGLALLEAGQIVIRLLVEWMPLHLRFRDPPLWPSIAGYAAGGASYLVLRIGVRRGRAWAKAGAAVVIVAALVGTYLSLNTVSIRPGPTSTPPLNALGESWRGAGWPGIVCHLEDFTLAPSGAWHIGHVAAAAFAMLVGFTALWFLATGRMRAPSVRRTGPEIVERIAGFSFAIHLSFHAVLTIAALVGLSSRIAGRL